jgi:hypothetical protein
MSLQAFLDIQIAGITIRNIARVIVFGGIAIILIRKLLRKIRQNREQRRIG